MNSTAPQASDSMVDFSELIAWYQSHCDDSWEHQHGVRLETLDNPGWLLTVDLIHTELEGHRMAPIQEGINPAGTPLAPRWLHCYVSGNQFRGACDPTQVARLFRAFDHFRRGALAL